MVCFSLQWALGYTYRQLGEHSVKPLGFLRMSHFFKNNKTSRHHLISAFSPGSCNLFCNCIPGTPDFFLRPGGKSPLPVEGLMDKEIKPRICRSPPGHIRVSDDGREMSGGWRGRRGGEHMIREAALVSSPQLLNGFDKPPCYIALPVLIRTGYGSKER